MNWILALLHDFKQSEGLGGTLIWGYAVRQRTFTVEVSFKDTSSDSLGEGIGKKAPIKNADKKVPIKKCR